jgi:hypothetical protein
MGHMGNVRGDKTKREERDTRGDQWTKRQE